MTLPYQSDILRDAEAAYKGAVADPVSYAPVAEELVARARAAGDHEALVVALRAQAWAEHALLGNDVARRRLNAAARVAVRHGLDDRLAEVLVSRAAAHHELGHVRQAQHDLDRAAALARGPLRCQVALQQGALHHNQGRLEAAEAIYRTTLGDPDCPADVWVKIANNLGYLLAQRGRADLGLRWLDEAVVGAQAVGPVLVAGVAQSRAWARLQAGRLTESLQEFEAAREVFEAAGLPLADYYLEYGDALVDLRLLGEATEVTRLAADELDEHGAELMAAEARLRLARLTLLTGSPVEAAAQAEEVVASLRRQRRTAWMAGALVTAVQARVQSGDLTGAQVARARGAAVTLARLGLVGGAVDAYLVTGRAATRLGRVEAARTAFQRAHELSRTGPVLVRLKGRVAAALAARSQDRPAEVLRHCRIGLDDLAEHRAALASMELRALASGHGAELGRLGLGALLPAGGPVRVLGWLERTRAAALVAVDPPVPPELQEELATLRAVHVELREARRLDGVEPVELLARQAALEARIRRATWSLGTLTQRRAGAGRSGAVSTARLREALGTAVLAEYGVLGDRVVAVVLDARRARLVEIGPLGPVLLERDALKFALRRITRSPRGVAAALEVAGQTLARLEALLVRPLGVPAGCPLVVVPSGELHGVSWSPLHDGPVTLAPSASFWVATREAPVPDGEAVALVAGPGLPGALAEVAELAALHARTASSRHGFGAGAAGHGGGRVGLGGRAASGGGQGGLAVATGGSPATLLPPASTAAAVVDLISGARLAHLACHGFLRTDNPTFSALQFCDGPLTVHELAATHAPAHRIVLAACESGAQVSYAGDEVLGLVSALMARGTAGVVAATIPVPDGESVPLMRGVHAGLAAGASLGDALDAARRAAGSTATDFADHPADVVAWCAYTAYGAA